MSYIGANDLVFNNNKVDGIFGGGFSVNSIMMKNGISPIMTLNTNSQKGTGSQKGGSTENKVSDMFGGLAVPAYAYYNNGGSTSKSNSYKNRENDNDIEDDVIDDDLHDKLLGLVKEHESRLTQEERKMKKTRKNKKNKNATTKRYIKKDILDVKR
jgi:hypothetical protein